MIGFIQMLLVFAVLFIVSAMLLHWNFKSISHGRAEELYDYIDPVYPVTPKEEQINLPESVKKYFKYSKSFDVESTVTCRLKLVGDYYAAPGGGKVPAEGRVFLNYQDYSFVSFIEAVKNPIVKVGVRESLQYGEGRYEMKRMGMSGIASVRNKQLTTSEMIHFLSYVPFGPTVLFDECFSFEEVAEGKVIMSYEVDDQPLQIEWRIDEEGKITHLICVRPILERQELYNRTWVVEYSDYQEVNDMMLPGRLVYKQLVEDNLLTTGDYYVKGVDIDSETPEKWKMD